MGIDKETQEKFDIMEKVILTLNKDMSNTNSRVSVVDDGLKKIHKELENMEIITREIREGSSVGDGGGGAIVSDADAELIIKKILLNDKELLETFKKIIENAISFNKDKYVIDSFVEKKNSKKKKSKIPLFSVIIGSIFLLVGVLYYFLNEKVTSVVLEAGESFYDSKAKDATPLSLGQRLEVEVTNESEDKYYFKLDKKEYFILKKKQ